MWSELTQRTINEANQPTLHVTIDGISAEGHARARQSCDRIFRYR